MDHGSLRDEPVSRSGPLLNHPHLDRRQHPPRSPPQHQQQPYPDHHDHHDHHDRRYDHITSPQTPAGHYAAAANLHAFSANALAPALSPDSPDDTVDPADFYRSHRTVPPTAGAGNASLPVKDSMASAVLTTTTRQPPSLRSNGNGTTPKHPAIPVIHRGALRPSQRSVSNPVDGRSENLGNGAGRASAAAGNGYGAAPAAGAAVPPSVRDLKKKFDQSASQSASATRKPAPRASARDTASSTVKSRPPSAASGATSHGAPRTMAARERDTGRDTSKSSGARSTTQRLPKFAAEDQAPANSQSFASRISRPRAAAPTPPQAAKPTTGAEIPNPRSPPPRQAGLLFGEILPDLNDAVTPGFGIETTRQRRTSESSLLINPARSQMRSLSDPDIEPSSPTDWYRAADSAGQRSTEHNVSRIPKAHHSRVRSDLSGTKSTLSRSDYGAARHDVVSPTSPTCPASPTSRLPRLTRRMNDASSRGSPVSTRSNSPSTFNKYSTASGRTSRQHVSRTKTPTGNAAEQAKPPSGHSTPSSSRKPPPSNISTQSGSRLNAYVSVPPAKLSPSLRSSRPRPSVANATTTASRMRVVERGVSPLRQSQRAPQKPEESTPRRRKVSVGAIDFAQRRETIKLAYSKSIRDNQAREARQAAAERRKKELVAVARAKIEAEAATAAALANAAAAATATPRPSRDMSRPSETEITQEDPRIEEPWEAAEDLPTPQPPAEEFRAPPGSLRLEIPGSFPNSGSPGLDHDQIPLSAVSMTSVVTEFDTEVQTEPPRHEGTAEIDESLGIQAAQEPAALEQPQLFEQPAAPALRKRASYRSPFDDEGDEDDSVSIKISLDTSVPKPQSSPELTPTRTTFEPEPVPAIIPPPAEDDEYVPRPYTFSDSYETTITILGPENDFQPFHKELPRATIPHSDLRQADEPPASRPPENVASEPPHHLRDPHFGTEPQVEIDDLDRAEDFYIGPRLRDHVAVLRDSVFASSDPSTPLDGHLSSAEDQKTPDPSHSLTVPGLLAPGNRSSQHSSWTDFSFGSEDRDAGHPSSTPHSHEVDTQDDGASFRVMHSTGDLSTCASSVGDLAQSPETSPVEKPDASPSFMLSELPASQQHLPEPEATECLTPDSELESGRAAPQPEREAPPPPPSEREYQRERSLYLAESRPDSYAYSQYSHDGNGDLSGTVSPPQSISQLRLDMEPSMVSLGETLYEGQTPLTEKEQEEQKRLRQRQLVIRELIDTEDAFVRDLTVVEEIYKGTAEACPNLDSKTVKLIFRNTDEIIAFHAVLLVEFKEAASAVYTPKGRRSPLPGADVKDSDSATLNSVVSTNKPERDDEKDRLTSLGPAFARNIEQLKAVHEVYLRSSDNSSKRLVQIQEDKTVMLWLSECNEVAKELTSAWNLDSLLIKPMQRITKYPDIITHLLKYTPEDHPDREALVSARTAVMEAIDDINKTKKNFELVGQIVSNRKRKESDVRAGLARAFGKRVDKLQVSVTKTAEDDEYQKLQQQFGDDYLRLQVVLRDVEYYTRSVATYVHEFLQYLSSMELVMRLQPSRDYAHLESKWVQFNVSMRDMEKIVLEKHVSLWSSRPLSRPDRHANLVQSWQMFENTLSSRSSKSSGATATLLSP